MYIYIFFLYPPLTRDSYMYYVCKILDHSTNDEKVNDVYKYIFTLWIVRKSILEMNHHIFVVNLVVASNDVKSFY